VITSTISKGPRGACGVQRKVDTRHGHPPQPKQSKTTG